MRTPEPATGSRGSEEGRLWISCQELAAGVKVKWHPRHVPILPPFEKSGMGRRPETTSENHPFRSDLRRRTFPALEARDGTPSRAGNGKRLLHAARRFFADSRSGVVAPVAWCEVDGPGGRLTTILPPMDRAFSPHDLWLAKFLGRCPRLGWDGPLARRG